MTTIHLPWIDQTLSVSTPTLYIAAAVGLLVGAAFFTIRGRLRSNTTNSRVTLLMVPTAESEDPAHQIESRERVMTDENRRARRRFMRGDLATVSTTIRPDNQGRLITLITIPDYIASLLNHAARHIPGYRLQKGESVQLPKGALLEPSAADSNHNPRVKMTKEGKGGAPRTGQGVTITRAFGFRIKPGQHLRAATTDPAEIGLHSTLAAICGELEKGEDFAVRVIRRPATPRELKAYRAALVDHHVKSKGGSVDTNRGGGRLAALGTAIGAGRDAPKARGGASIMDQIRAGAGLESAPKTRATATPRTGSTAARNTNTAESRRNDQLNREAEKIANTEAGKSTRRHHVVRVVVSVRGNTATGAKRLMKSVAAALGALEGDDGSRITPETHPLRVLDRLLGRTSGQTMIAQASRHQAPRRGPLVSTSDIAPLLMPAPKGQGGDNVRRVVVMPDVPRDLVVYRQGDPTMVPMGKLARPDGSTVIIAMPTSAMRHGNLSAPSENGKSALLTARTVAAVRAGGPAGHFWYDPEGKVFGDAAPYLTGNLRGRKDRRIHLIDMNNSDYGQPAYNPLDMSGLPEEAMAIREAAWVGALATATGWNRTAQRALALHTNATRALLYLNYALCRAGRHDLQATVFTERKFLINETFRDLVLRFVPASSAEYWAHEFKLIAKDATPVVTQVLSALDGPFTPAGAMLGQPVSTFSFADAFTRGDLTFVTPGNDQPGQIITALFMHEFLRAATARQPGDNLIPQYAYLDELPQWDDGELVPAFFETLNKRRVYVTGMEQSPLRLSERTRRAVMANVSWNMVGPTSNEDTAFWSKNFGVSPAAFSTIQQHEYLTQMRHNGEMVTLHLQGIQTSDLKITPHPEKVADPRQRISEQNAHRTRAQVTEISEKAHYDLKVWMMAQSTAAAAPTGAYTGQD